MFKGTHTAVLNLCVCEPEQEDRRFHMVVQERSHFRLNYTCACADLSACGYGSHFADLNE